MATPILNTTDGGLEDFSNTVRPVAEAYFFVRYGARFIFRRVISKAPKFFGGEAAKHVLQEVVIGSVPAVIPGTRLTPFVVGLSVFNVSFWLMGGFGALLDSLKQRLGLPRKPVGDFYYDELPPDLPNSNLWARRSVAGAVGYVTLNPKRIDP